MALRSSPSSTWPLGNARRPAPGCASGAIRHQPEDIARHRVRARSSPVLGSLSDQTPTV
jgi:hypothetical protein